MKILIKLFTVVFVLESSIPKTALADQHDETPETGARASNSVPVSRIANAQSSSRGRLLYIQCRSCHSLSAEDGHLVGPNLDGLFGSIAGRQENFVYSDAISTSGMTWTKETLAAFLTQPSALFPGTKMAFAGITDAADRRLLIDYIQQQTNE